MITMKRENTMIRPFGDKMPGGTGMTACTDMTIFRFSSMTVILCHHPVGRQAPHIL